ncbi:hypothetical protein B0H13DRAFT_1858157 [Mycena leptocephala]|nr:hypothetical protein B0H13DRAFT_1858157 [Mycena leptocephala]
MPHLSTDVYCRQCDLYFVDVEARSEHIKSSPSHPFCKTCCSHFLNENSLSLHLECAAHHLSPRPSQQAEEILDGDEVLLNWTSGIASYLNIPDEEDYWSSEWDADSNSSTSDSGNELGSDPGTEHNDFLVGIEPGPEYRELLFENFVNSSEIPVHCHCLGIPKSEVMIAIQPDD